MTKLERIHLRCPNCETQFDSTRLDAVDALGPKHTDFHVDADWQRTLCHAIHVCRRCGFAGSEGRFFSTAGVNYNVQRRVWSELAPRVGSSPLPASERYEFAALIATWDGAPLRSIGDLWLRAAWCCVDEDDVEAERYYRRHAAWSFERSLAEYDSVDRADRAVLTYLVGELWRRVGDEALAKEWFDRVSEEIVDFPEQEWVARWAKQQHDNPREWFV
jgi:uncharacterized protein